MQQDVDVARMEVWCGFAGRWVDGFDLVEIHPAEGGAGERYVVRRRSDGAVLPSPFTSTQVRSAVTASPWSSIPVGGPVR